MSATDAALDVSNSVSVAAQDTVSVTAKSLRASTEELDLTAASGTRLVTSDLSLSGSGNLNARPNPLLVFASFRS